MQIVSFGKRNQRVTLRREENAFALPLRPLPAGVMVGFRDITGPQASSYRDGPPHGHAQRREGLTMG